DVYPRSWLRILAILLKMTPGGFPPEAPGGVRETNLRSFPRPKVISGLSNGQIALALLRWPFVEDAAHTLLIEPQTESVFLRKLGDLLLSIFLIYGPNPFQFLVANHAVLPYAVHPSFDLSR